MAPFNEVDQNGQPVEHLDLTGPVADGHENKKERPTIEFGAVTSASSTILLAHNQPEKKIKKTATTTTPDTIKADSWKSTLTPNSNSHLSSSQQTSRSGESSDTIISPSPAQPSSSSSSKLKRLNPFTNESKDNDNNDDDGYIDIDAPPPKKPRLSPSHNNTTPSAPSNHPMRFPVSTDLTPASLQRSLTAATDQIKRERARRRKAERRVAEYAQHGAPVMRTAARLARWVVDMYEEHQQRQGGRREDEVEAFLGEIRDYVGAKAWGRLLWLGGFLRDNLDDGEGGEGDGAGAKDGAVKLEREVKKEAAGRDDGVSEGEKVAEVAKGGGAVAKGTMKLEERVSMKSSVSLVEAAIKLEKS